jgi:protein CLEC16A
MWRLSITEKQSSNESRFSLIHLRQLHKDLYDNKIVNNINENVVVEILRELAEMVVYGDNKSELLFDFFCEKNMLSLFLEIMWIDGCPNSIHIQILQTLSILIKCVKNDTSLYYLLSNNYINEVIIFPFNLENDESLRDQFASFMKSLSLRLDNQTVQFFFIEDTGAFPILMKAIEMLQISEPMVRTASQATILNVYKVDDIKSRHYSLQDQVMNSFFVQIVTLFEGHYATLLALCQEHLVYNNQSYQANIDDDIALKTFTNHISDLFNSIQDWFYYLSDVYELDIAKLQISLTVHLMTEFILPTLLSPFSNYESSSPSSSPSVDEEKFGDSNTNKLQLNMIVSLTFLNHLLKIIQDPLLHRVITIVLFDRNPGNTTNVYSHSINNLHSTAPTSSKADVKEPEDEQQVDDMKHERRDSKYSYK